MRKAIAVLVLLAAASCGCTLCPEKDFDKSVTQKTFYTFFPASFYDFSDSDFKGEARIDGIGFQARRSVRENIYLGASFRGEGCPVDKSTSSVFYDGVVEFNRLFLTADYELVISRNPLLRLGFGISPGFVFSSTLLDEDFEDDLTLKGQKVRQSLQNAFDLWIGAKIIWNPKTTVSDVSGNESVAVLKPGFSLNIGYDFTAKSRARSKIYDSVGTIESASKRLDLGGFFLSIGIDF